MQIDSPAMPRAKAAPIGSDELAEGLMLVRASTLKIIRLQLAMERHDRRVALEVVDDLVKLDRRLQDCLAIASAGDKRILFRHELEAERAMLSREKLALAAEVLRRPPETEQRRSSDDDWLGPRDAVIEHYEPRARHRWLIAIPILMSAVAASAYFIGIPEIQAWIAAGGLR